MRKTLATLVGLVLALCGFSSEQNLALEVEVTLWGLSSGTGSSFSVELQTQTFPSNSAPVSETLEVGKPYDLEFDGANLDPGASFSFLAPDGYRVLISGVPKSREIFTTDTVLETRTLIILPETKSLAAGAFDYEESLRNIVWKFGLGQQSNGETAGMLEIRQPLEGSQTAVLDRSELVWWTSDSPEIDFVEDSGGIRQILTRWALIDIQDANSGPGIDITYYDIADLWSQADTYLSGGVYTAFGERFARYELREGTEGDATKTRVKITEIRGTATAHESTVRHLYYSEDAWDSAPGTPGWIFRDDGGLSVVKIYDASYPAFASGAIMSESGGGTETWSSSFQHNFTGTAESPVLVKSIRANQPGDPNYTTDYAWYPTTADDGDVGQLKSVIYSDGNWSWIDYADVASSTELDNGRVFGLPETVARAWLDDAPSATNGAVSSILYASNETVDGTSGVTDDPVRTRDLPFRVTRTRSGTTLGKTDNTYVTKNGSGQRLSINGLPYVAKTTKQYTSSTDSLSTVTKTYDYDLEVGSGGLDASYFRNQPVSVEHSDGRKDSWLARAMSLTHDSVNETVSRASSASPHTGWELSVFHGVSTNESGSSYYSYYYGGNIDPLYLIPFQSTLEVTVVDAPFILRETWLFIGGTGQWTKVDDSWERYHSNGLLMEKHNANGTGYTATIENNRLTKVVHEDGRAQYFFHDVLGRLEYEITMGSPDDGVPHQIVRFTRDAEGRVLQRDQVGDLTAGTGFNPEGAGFDPADSFTGLPEMLTSQRSYDLGGRLDTETAPCGTTVIYAYDKVSGYYRKTTATRSDFSSTEITQIHRDGRVQSVTGTGVVNEFYGYSFTGGLHVTQTRLGSALSTRLSTRKTDWLGRVVEASVPNTDGGTVTESRSYFEGTSGASSGKLESVSRPGMATQFYEYAGGQLGRLSKSWLNVDGSPGAGVTGTDRIQDFTTQFVQDAGQWWVESLVEGYPNNGSSTKVVLTRTRQRVTGFNAGGTGGGVVFEQRQWGYNLPASSSLFTKQTVDLDPAIATVTTQTTAPGVTNPAREILLHGMTVASEAPDGSSVDLVYDALGRLKVESPSRGDDREYTYHGGTTNLDEIKGPDASGTLVTLRTHTYLNTGCGPLVLVEDAFGETTRYAYNARGQITRTWGSATQPVEYDHNAYGERTDMWTYRTATDADTATFPESTHSGDRTQWGFDAATGLLRSKTDAASHVTKFQYDSANRLEYRILPWTHTTGTVIGRMYRQHSYDSGTGELTGLSYKLTNGVSADPASGDPGDDLTGWVVTTYDRLGRVATVADGVSPEGRSYVYDPSHGQLTSITWPSLNSLYPVTVEVGSSYDSYRRFDGLSLKADDVERYNTDWTYYPASGLLRTAKEKIAGETSAFTFTYLTDTALPDTVSWGGSSAFSRVHTYEPYRNLLSSVANKSGIVNRATYAYGRDKIGRSVHEIATGEIFTPYPQNELTTFYKTNGGMMGYNARGELIAAKTYHGSDPQTVTTEVGGRAWSFNTDTAGNRDDRWRQGKQTSGYAHNALNQFTGQNVPNYAAVSGFSDADDLYVNWIPVTRQGEHFFVSENVDNSSAPQKADFLIAGINPGDGPGGTDLVNTAEVERFVAQSPTPMTYDASGNRLTDANWTYTWDGENRLKKMETSAAAVSAGMQKLKLSFVYDAHGRRCRKIVEEDTGSGWSTIDYALFIYQGYRVIAVINGDSTLRQSFHWNGEGPGSLLSMTDHGTSTTYLAGYDGRGNLTLLLDAAGGSIAAAYEYAPFGEVVRISGEYASENPIGFSANFTDRESGYIDYGLRFYLPLEGRFLNRDPIEEAGGNNLYTAFGGDPVNYWDYLGLDMMWTDMSSYFRWHPRTDDLPIFELPPFEVSVCPWGTIKVNGRCAIVTRAGPEATYWNNRGFSEGGGGLGKEFAPVQGDDQKEDPEAHGDQQLQDCYDAAHKSHSSSIELLGRLENDRTEAVFENLVHFDEIAKQNFNIAVFDTVDTVFKAMAVGTASGGLLSFRYARVAKSAQGLYRSARSMASVSRLGSVAAKNQHLANNLAALGGLAGGTSYSFAVGDFNSGATILDFALGSNGVGSILVGINQNIQDAIDASGVSNETAAAIIGGIKSSTNRTREAFDSRLSAALSECDKKYK